MTHSHVTMLVVHFNLLAGSHQIDRNTLALLQQREWYDTILWQHFRSVQYLSAAYIHCFGAFQRASDALRPSIWREIIPNIELSTSTLSLN